MDRLERLRNKGLDEKEWQKLWNKYQEPILRTKLVRNGAIRAKFVEIRVRFNQSKV